MISDESLGITRFPYRSAVFQHPISSPLSLGASSSPSSRLRQVVILGLQTSHRDGPSGLPVEAEETEDDRRPGLVRRVTKKDVTS